MPSARTPLSVIAYRLPLNSAIPTRNAKPATCSARARARAEPAARPSRARARASSGSAPRSPTSPGAARRPRAAPMRARRPCAPNAPSATARKPLPPHSSEEKSFHTCTRAERPDKTEAVPNAIRSAQYARGTHEGLHASDERTPAAGNTAVAARAAARLASCAALAACAAPRARPDNAPTAGADRRAPIARSSAEWNRGARAGAVVEQVADLSVGDPYRALEQDSALTRGLDDGADRAHRARAGAAARSGRASSA